MSFLFIYDRNKKNLVKKTFYLYVINGFTNLRTVLIMQFPYSMVLAVSMPPLEQFVEFNR